MHTDAVVLVIPGTGCIGAGVGALYAFFSNSNTTGFAVGISIGVVLGVVMGAACFFIYQIVHELAQQKSTFQRSPVINRGNASPVPSATISLEHTTVAPQSHSPRQSHTPNMPRSKYSKNTS